MAARSGALAAALLSQLSSAGADPIFVEIGDSYAAVSERRFQVRQGRPEDIAAVERHIQARRISVRGAIYIWTEAPGDLTAAQAGYHALVSLAESLQGLSDGRTASLIVATFGAQSVLDEPVQDYTAALALGPVLVLPTEAPGLTASKVDFVAESAEGEPAVVAKALVEEAGAGGAENIVAWRCGRRWVRRYSKLALPPADPSDLPLKANGVYLITGGLGGIGLSLAGWLSRQCAARLLLTARTAAPPREEWDRILETETGDSGLRKLITELRDIESAGGEVLVAQADAADFDQMAAAIALARSRWGEIDGVIHAAGVPGDGRFAVLKSAANVHSVVSPKAHGLTVLTRLLGARPLDFVVLMSSINAVLGAPGACDYSAANAVLDAFVDSVERPTSWPNISVFDWAAWRDVGMAANLAVPESRRAIWQENLRSGIPTAAGIELFSRALAAGARRVVVSPHDLVEMMRFAAVVSSRAAGEPAVAREPTGKAAPKPAPGSPTEVSLAEIWGDLLGLAKIDADADFFELGGHSLLATRMMSRIHDIFGVRISLRDVFDAPTVRKLASRISSAGAGSTPEIDESLEEREELIF